MKEFVVAIQFSKNVLDTIPLSTFSKTLSDIRIYLACKGGDQAVFFVLSNNFTYLFIYI